MSSITFADNKLGGRLMAACDAIAAGHLNRAAGILAELSDELNVEATQAGLLSEDIAPPPVRRATKKDYEANWSQAEPEKFATSADLQMCARGVHSYSAPDPVSGWRECAICGSVNVAPPSDGPYDMSARQ